MRDLNLSKQTYGGARQTSVDMLETSRDMGDMLRLPRGVCETSGDVRATSEDV